MIENNPSIESLEAWLAAKPFWEQHVWKLNLEKDVLTKDDLDLCYTYLLEHLGIIEPLSDQRPVVSFKNEIGSIGEPIMGTDRIKLVEIKGFMDVNAIPEDCSIKVGPNLTLIYGANGSGKSGISRLLCNACFSRGEREVLPNVRLDEAGVAEATFVVQAADGSTRELTYSLGDDIDDLKRFAVFDAESVLIHLDQSNRVNFTPAQIKIFDKVADTIAKLEERLANERNARRKANPFSWTFFDRDTSATAVFCKGLTAVTKEVDLLEHASFDPELDGRVIADLQKQIDEKRKLDIPKRKKQLSNDRQNLSALKVTLQTVVDYFSIAKEQELNQLVIEIAEKKTLVESLSVSRFDDGLLQTIGSPQWKALIVAAKELHAAEVNARKSETLAHCPLCHQKLTRDAQELFARYWQFLESKAESELALLMRRQTAVLQDLRSSKALHPKLLDTDAGVKILLEQDVAYLARLKIQFEALAAVNADWEAKIGRLEKVDTKEVPTVNLSKIDRLIKTKEAEENKLVDPTTEIATLTAQLVGLKDKEKVASVKGAALEYLAYLQWSAKADKAGFAGIKMATTKKRTESFLFGVARNYKGIFNQELSRLDCNFNLVMRTSGAQGNTVKEYRLDFAVEYNPSEILSEGEQNACSLADFLTEIQLDKNNCGIIFDDPVTSLDHERKDKIAKRLAIEAGERQVVVFTHDIVFMSQLVKHAERNSIPAVAHWMRKIDGIPGNVEDNTSPRLTSLTKLKNDSQDAVRDFSSLGAKEQERALGAAFDYLRSATEALIEEILFAGTIQRYDDHIKVTNLEEVIFDQSLALQIVELHGRLSEVILAHNRSDQKREDPPDLDDLKALRKDFDVLEAALRVARRTATDGRATRKKAKVSQKLGW
ncbi:energy-coupling factor transporter ATP-binding protein EcfA2 [Bradyrhizobium sp. USDA 3311]